ncbi:lipopolysaccharide kinase InaA family protein [Bizionia sp. KMM 8389]
MRTNHKVHQSFLKDAETITNFVSNYETSGTDFGNQDRNSLKLFDLHGQTVNVKSFKVPNFINQVAYRFFRKSKAQRSYEYANRLLSLGIGTPQPIAYYEYKTPFLFKNSYYVSAHLPYDLTYRELTFDFNMPHYEAILRAFTAFTYQLHEAGVHFLDHSPGNTLIQLNNGDYKFYLVDLNRMNFGPMDFETRIKNFARLTTHKSMVAIMSDAYAKLSGYDYDAVYNVMWGETEAFQNRFQRKRRLKNKFLFWRKKG